jgi:hypothetical protein
MRMRDSLARATNTSSSQNTHTRAHHTLTSASPRHERERGGSGGRREARGGRREREQVKEKREKNTPTLLLLLYTPSPPSLPNLTLTTSTPPNHHTHQRQLCPPPKRGKGARTTCREASHPRPFLFLVLSLCVYSSDVSLSMKFRPIGSAPRDVNAPRAAAKATAYRLCQPMHVLSFGEGL